MALVMAVLRRDAAIVSWGVVQLVLLNEGARNVLVTLGGEEETGR